MKPLLWKEMRDLGPALAGAGALLVVLRLLCLDERIESNLLNAYAAMMPIIAWLIAIGLGASQVARERASRTLDFLLARPIAPAAIVWMKFLAGSVALVLLVTAMTALCFIDPRARLYESILYRAVGFPQFVAVLFPRVWCSYALAFWLSVLMDRTAKAAVAAFVSLLALGYWVDRWGLLFPFSNVREWQLLWDSMLPLRLAHDPAQLLLTGLTLCVCALLMALAASLLFRRSPGWTMGNRALILGAVALACLAEVSLKAAASRLPAIRPAGWMELAADFPYDRPSMGAGGGVVALAAEDRLQFLDFTDPAHPRIAADTRMPLWTTLNLEVNGSRAYILGRKKALPADEVQVVIASPAPSGAVQFGEPIALGANDRSWFAVSTAVAGHYLYVDAVRQDQFRVEAYDLSPGASGRLTGAVAVEDIRSQRSDPHGAVFPGGATHMRLQGQFLYVTSPQALTAVDIRDPGRPAVTSRTAYNPPVPSMSASVRGLASDGRWLLEGEPLLDVWNVYDLADPAHPARSGHVPKQRLDRVAGSGPLLFEGWRGGLLEFRASGGGLEALSYLADGRVGETSVLDAADGYAYMLKRVEDRRYLSAYRVGR